MPYQVLLFLLCSFAICDKIQGLLDPDLSAPDFRCNIYGHIYLANPDPKTYKYVVAVDYDMIGTENNGTDIICDTHRTNSIIESLFIIAPSTDGFCGKGRTIMVTVSNTSFHTRIVTSVPFKQVYLIRCNDIGSPMQVNVTQILHSQDGFDDMPSDEDIKEVTVSVGFDKSIRSLLIPCCDASEKAKPVESTQVGTHLLWVLKVDSDYFMRPLTCTAHAGKSASSSPSAVILDGGCAVDERLVTQREYIDSWGYSSRAYVMNLFAFHFYTSQYITIVCHTELCSKKDEELCEWTCPFQTNRYKRNQRSSLTSPRNQSVIETTLMTVKVFGDLNTGSIPGISSIWILLLVWTLQRLFFMD